MIVPAPVAAPERSLQQRLDALQKGNRIRIERAERKRELKRGERKLEDLVADPPVELDSMKVRDLLLAAPKIGAVKADALLRAAVVSPSKTVGGLSTRQRSELHARIIAERVAREARTGR